MLAQEPTRRLILVIEDEPGRHATLTPPLNHAGYDVRAVGHGNAAISAVVVRQPEAVLVGLGAAAGRHHGHVPAHPGRPGQREHAGHRPDRPGRSQFVRPGRGGHRCRRRRHPRAPVRGGATPRGHQRRAPDAPDDRRDPCCRHRRRRERRRRGPAHRPHRVARDGRASPTAWRPASGSMRPRRKVSSSGR